MHDDEITIERIQRALVTCAYIVLRHGTVYAPIMDRLEAELEAAKQRGDPRDRARRVLEAYTLPGDLKAIC